LIRPWTIGLSVIATLGVLLRHLLIALGPQAQFYAMTALQLMGVLLVLVLLFMGVSSLTISLLGRIFRERLRNSYVLFLGWNMLRSQRLTRPLWSRVQQGLTAPNSVSTGLGRILGTRILLLSGFVGIGFSLNQFGGRLPLWLTEWVFIHLGLLGIVFILQAIGKLASSPKKKPGPLPALQLRNSVTLPNFISMVGVGIGVWALIVVMAVMSGFEEDLRSKILETNPHILVSPTTYDSGLQVTEETMASIQALSEVSSTERFLEEEAMITSPYNSSVQLTIRGINPGGMTSERLEMNLVDGSLELLKRPQALGSDQAWEFSQERSPGKLIAPAQPQEMDDKDQIVMPPMPGGSLPQPPDLRQISTLISENFARALGAELGSELSLSPGNGEKPIPLTVTGIYKRVPSLTYQPDWLIELRDSSLIPPAAIHTKWPVSHGEAEALGRVAVLESGTPLFKTVSTHLLVGDMPGNEGKKAPGILHPYSERVVPGVVLGTELASSLRVRVGDEVQLISMEGEVGPMGIRPKARTFRVAGIFETGMYEFDLKLAYALRDETARFFGRNTGFNRMEIQLANPADPEETTGTIRSLLPDSQEVHNWQNLNRNLFSALKLEKIAMFFVLGFIILVASFNIVSSLAMLIQEKSQEIAILKSMGATDEKVMSAFISVGLFLGLIGAGCGALMGVGCCILVDRVGVPLPKEYYIPTIPVEVNGVEVFAAFVAAMAICVVATLYPSRAAARLTPVEGLRYE